MAAQGHTSVTHARVQDPINDQIQRLWDEVDPEAPAVTPDIRTRLEAIRAEEIALAVAHFDCSESWELAVWDAVVEVEQGFIEEHRAAIDSFLENR